MPTLWTPFQPARMEIQPCRGRQVDQEDAEISFGEIPMNRLSSDIVWFPLSSTVSGLWQAWASGGLEGSPHWMPCSTDGLRFVDIFPTL